MLGPNIDSSRWPAAEESEEGTVQDEIITNINPIAAINLPMVLFLPDIVIPKPIGTKISGSQNHIAASSIAPISTQRNRLIYQTHRYIMPAVVRL